MRIKTANLKEYRRAYQKAYMQMRRDKGLCLRCGRTARVGMKSCLNCALLSSDPSSCRTRLSDKNKQPSH